MWESKEGGEEKRKKGDVQGTVPVWESLEGLARIDGKEAKYLHFYNDSCLFEAKSMD